MLSEDIAKFNNFTAEETKTEVERNKKPADANYTNLVKSVCEFGGSDKKSIYKNFLVGTKSKNEPLAIDELRSLSPDGLKPDEDLQILINAFICTFKELTAIYLTSFNNIQKSEAQIYSESQRMFGLPSEKLQITKNSFLKRINNIRIKFSSDYLEQDKYFYKEAECYVNTEGEVVNTIIEAKMALIRNAYIETNVMQKRNDIKDSKSSLCETESDIQQVCDYLMHFRTWERFNFQHFEGSAPRCITPIPESIFSENLVDSENPPSIPVEEEGLLYNTRETTVSTPLPETSIEGFFGD